MFGAHLQFSGCCASLTSFVIDDDKFENQLEDMMEIVSGALATVEIAAAKLSGVKMASLLSFISGAAVMLGFSNLVGSKQSQHVYELRMYHVNEGKMDALVSQNLFVYILEHPSSEEARKNWAAFQADPEWQKVKADSEINGALANHIDSYLMDPTSFSGLK